MLIPSFPLFAGSWRRAPLKAIHAVHGAVAQARSAALEFPFYHCPDPVSVLLAAIFKVRDGLFEQHFPSPNSIRSGCHGEAKSDQPHRERDADGRQSGDRCRHKNAK
jgi:hypothetical protein